VRKEAWALIARRRILNILRQRRIASSRQLEAKISEAGPGYMRANPHHIWNALTDLENENEIQQPVTLDRGTKLYTLPSWDPTSNAIDQQRLKRVIPAYEEYFKFQSEDAGNSLETVVQKAIEQSNQYTWVNAPGKAPASGLTLSNVDVTGKGVGKLDHYLVHGATLTRVGVEDKNYREWVYPSHTLIRPFLHKCVTYQMLPVLVTRRVHFTTRILFSRLGAIALETYFQFTNPRVEQTLADVRHRDGVGFADIRFTDAPSPHVVNLFSKRLPSLIPRYWETFNNNIELIKDYSDVGSKMTGRELKIELGILEEDEEEEEEIYEEDYPQ